MIKYFEINESGHNIRCKIFAKDLHQIKKLVVFLHGFAGHKDNASTEKFADRVLTKYKNIGVLIYDQPAHGDDVKRRLLLEDCTTYLTMVISEVKRRFQPEKIYGYGISFGCFLILKYLNEKGNPFEKMILRCPAVNMFESLTTKIVRPEEMTDLESGKPVKVGFDRKVEITGEFLESLKAHDVRKNEYFDFADNILILQGTKDEIIPPELVRKFSEDNCIELVEIEGADHRFQNPMCLEEATKRALEFFGF